MRRRAWGRVSAAMRAHSYIALLRSRDAKLLTLAAAAHRCGSFVLSLGITLVLVEHLHSYSKAGLGSGLFILAGAVCEPLQGRICDRVGARRPLRILTVLFAASTSAMLVAAMSGAPLLAVYALCVLAGLTLPFIRGPARVIWWRILDDERDRVAASAFEGTIGPLAYSAGYAVFGVIALIFSPAAAVVVAVALLLVGAVGVSALSAETPAHAPVAGHHLLRTLSNGPLLAVLAVTFAGFFAQGTLQVALIARTSGSTASLLLALTLLSTSVYGVCYGVRPSSRVPEVAQLYAAASFAVGILALVVAGPMWALVCALVVFGAVRAPLFIYTYHLSAAYVVARHRTEAVAWNGAALWAGMAAGKTVGGFVADSASVSAVLASALPIAAVGLLCSAWLVRHDRGARSRRSALSDELEVAGGLAARGS